MMCPMRYALLTALLVTCNVHASAAAQVRASHAWIRVLPGNLPAGAYVTLKNAGDEAVDLTSASSPSYAQAMLHKSSLQGGMSHMAMVAALSIPAHGQRVLAPAGYHLMLMDPRQQVNPGDIIEVELTFSDGSTLATSFLARPANALGDGPAVQKPSLPAAKTDPSH